jgi:hypothetical protein
LEILVVEQSLKEAHVLGLDRLEMEHRREIHKLRKEMISDFFVNCSERPVDIEYLMV